MYYQCLAIYPAAYNFLLRWRKNKAFLLGVLAFANAINMAILMGFWFAVKDSGGFEHYDPVTGYPNTNSPLDSEDLAAAQTNNGLALGYYLFGPFWWQYFISGICTVTRTLTLALSQK